MVRKRKAVKDPYSEKARLVMLIEDLAIVAGKIGDTDNKNLDDRSRLEMKDLSDRYWKLGRQLANRWKLTKEQQAFTEAELVVESVIFAKDCTHHFNGLLQRHLPKQFIKDVRRLAKEALGFRDKFYMPKSRYEERHRILKKLKLQKQKKDRR